LIYFLIKNNIYSPPSFQVKLCYQFIIKYFLATVHNGVMSAQVLGTHKRHTCT